MCLATEWSPKLFARLVYLAIEGVFPRPLVDVYGYNGNTDYVSEVAPSTYEAIYKSLSGDLTNDLLILPANHFVWSDEFASAYSAYIHNVIGYEEAHEEGLKIRWDPEIADELAAAIDECADFSKLIERITYQNSAALDSQSNDLTADIAIGLSSIAPERSIIPMQVLKRTSNGWFDVIDACIRDFENEHNFTPTKFELWQKLHDFQDRTLGRIGSEKISGEEHLTLVGAKPLGRQAFGKRYNRLYPS